MKRFLVLQQSGGKLTGSVRRDGSVTAVSAKAALEVCVNMMEDAAGVHRVGVAAAVEKLWVVEVGEVRFVDVEHHLPTVEADAFAEAPT